MKNATTISFLLLLGIVYYSFFSLMPQRISKLDQSELEFSTQRALIPLKEISKSPHYVGSEDNTRVRNFIVQSLRELDLDPEVQEGYIFNEKRGRLTKPANILATIKGSEDGKALLVFSHYDSALTPSFGASDAGSGVVTILESLRAFKASGKQPKNDIVILFTDAEEVGLEGAKLFVRSHPLAKNIGLAINFEARGSGGPSSMILETNGGNKNLIQGFIKANPEFPVASSLLYSIYKMLPNDTDSTILREEGAIDGLFFAFIDDHFDYHTAGDNFERLDRNSLEHQGSYLMPLLHFFADADLSNIKSDQDYVYTNFPLVKMIAYPFDWVMPSLLIAALMFFILLLYGFKKGKLGLRSLLKGFIPFTVALVAAFLIGFFGWSILLKIYPHYQEILQGFPYNGHTYIAFFVSLTLGVIWYTYHKFQKNISPQDLLVAPLLLWLLINIILGIYLKGAAYFIIPFYFALLSFGLLINQEKESPFVHLILAVPALILFSPLIQTFPIGLGLASIVISTVLTVLLFGLLLPLFSIYNNKIRFAQGFLALAVCCFFYAHFTSNFNQERKKPNSLLFFKDLSTDQAFWLTYDKILDDWNKMYLGENPETASELLPTASYSKYNSGYTFAAKAPNKEVSHYQFTLLKDTLVNKERSVTFLLSPTKKANILQLFVNDEVNFKTLSFNGIEVEEKTSLAEKNKRILTFFVSGLDSLKVSFKTPKEQNPTFTLLEYSFDLLKNPLIQVQERKENMMPKPFIINDAIVVKQKINIR